MRSSICRFLIIVSFIVYSLVGCSNEFKPVEVVETDFDPVIAEDILKASWAAVNNITSDDYVTMPDVHIKSIDDFINMYRFDYMNAMFVHSLCGELIEYNENYEEKKDINGNINFRDDTYVPTIYHPSIEVTKAFIRHSKYNETYSSMNKTELVIMEEYVGTDNASHISGYSRTNYLEKNEEGTWILMDIQGTICISWERSE